MAALSAGTSSIETPVLCLLVSGSPSVLERISRAVEQETPWLVLAGSGGMADVLAALVGQRHLLVPQVVEKQLREKFPSQTFSWEAIGHWTKLLQHIAAYPQLLTVYDFEQEGSEDLDTVLLKALVKACRSHSQDARDYLDELKLAVAWNRVDVAKSEIFNGDVEWQSCHLEEVLMDALVGNKPEFVRLFVDSGADVGAFLTYGRLQQLYRSVCPKSLLFDLLQRKLDEGRLTLAGLGTPGARGHPAGPPAFSLHEVSRLLKDFLHDACRGLYQDSRATGRRRTERGPSKRPTGHKWPLDLSQKSEDPWRDLFLWAVLQNRHEMATYFWAMAFLTRIWWGDMAAGTPVLRLLAAFTCPVLVYTSLITFSKEAPLRAGPEAVQELDELATGRSLLGSRREELVPALGGWRDRGPQAAFLLTRWRKFWGAPVTVFLGNVVMYFAFLFLFAYVLLLDFRSPPWGPTGPEVGLYFWVFTLVLEEIRQGFFTDEDMPLVDKFSLYVEDNWNKCDMVAIFLFVVGVTCRVLPALFEAGRTVLAMDFMVFTLRLIHIFAIHKQLGPKIIIVERMMKDVFFFLFFLGVWLVAYGVATQALLHPHDGRLEWIFRRVLYRPYLQIFGQIPLDELDEARVNCSVHPLLLENSPSCPNLYANWLVILLLVTFLLVTNVLLMNLLIAMFSYTFQVVQGNADMFWKFQRYNLIVEYHGRPALAPPLILLSHLSLALRRLLCKEAGPTRERLGEGRGTGGRLGPSPQHSRAQLSSPLPPERDLPEPLDQKIVTWETLQKENLLSSQEKLHRESQGEVLRKTAHRVELVAQSLGGLREQERRLRGLESQASGP
ncbi:transient receptor potential cation channel subfamily M member 5 isoform X6 [Ochotona princeps]|uniref:transient receptor potential cation channel subfamily M member 5 isoform X6 n=1 Tax=Ochotona princeps TaxID=9978 RepID=UPI0027153B02|nr:transient receptor potential cation channel subfamily M member 5 isoform X6 [Ochotona princeps]